MVTISNDGKIDEKLNHSYFAGGIVKQYSYSGKRFGSFL